MASISKQPPRLRPAPRGTRLIEAVLGIIEIVAVRLWSHLALVMALIAGFAVAIGLVVSIPVYAEAVGYRVLRDQYTQYTYQNQLRFDFLYRYLGAQGGITWQQHQQLADYFTERAQPSVGLPVLQRGHFVATSKRSLVAPRTVSPQLASVNLAFADNFEQQIDLVAGRMPLVNAEGPVEVLMTAELAERIGAQPGITYYVLDAGRNYSGNGALVTVTGTWQPKDAQSPFWFYSDMLSDDMLYLPQEGYTSRLLARDPRAINAALWSMGADGSVIRSAGVTALEERIARSGTEFEQVLEGAQLNVSPGGVLRTHQQRVEQLTLILTVFSVPLLALIAYFVLLIGGLVIQRQANEIAVLRSRGVSRLQVLTTYLVEGALIALIALIPGPLLGQGAALLMTWVRSFLEIAPISGLPIEMTPDAWWRAAQIMGLLILASLIPALGAAGYTIVSFKNDRNRLTRRPLWQRFGLDLLLLAVVIYGYWQLASQGSIVIGNFRAESGDPFTNPLLLLAPTLYIFVLALVSVRVFPPLVGALLAVATQLPGVAAVTAMRYLARTPRAYMGPVLLLVLTLSLSIFTASMAQTLDRQLFDRVYYTVGSDMQVTDQGRVAVTTQASGGTGSLGGGESRRQFRPVRDYLGIPGVMGITRVLQSPAELPVRSGSVSVNYVGVDASNFPGIARWRADYADQPVGALMNRLAAEPGSVLVSSELRDSHGLRVGEQLLVKVYGSNGTFDMPVTVAGFVRLFPTVYPEDGPFVVGNIEHAFARAGGPYTYDVWLRLNDDADRTVVETNLKNLGMDFIVRGYAPKEIGDERGRPERQGLFGLLLVGFAASAFLTVLGFLFYAVLSFQRRFVELGMMRAIGLSSRQLGWLLGCEQALIIGIGALSGTIIGISATYLFIPFLQVRAGAYPNTPPFLVELAWGRIGAIYLIFGLMLVSAVFTTLLLLRRMKLFQAVKLGETV